MPIDLYSLSLSPPCRAVLMGLKHLKIDANIKNVDLTKGEHLTPEYLKLNPAHTVPTLVDGDLTLWESRAILQYLCNKYAPTNPLYPSDPKKRAIVDRTLNFDVSLYASIRDARLLKVFRGVDPTEQQITSLGNNLKLLDTLIGDNKYVTGNEVTIADLSVLASVFTLGLNDFEDLKDLPKLKGWLERIQHDLPYHEEVNGQVLQRFKELQKK